MRTVPTPNVHGAPATLWKQGRRVLRPSTAVAALLVLGLFAAGCANGTYPVDIFYEMHYQQSYASGEPPRLSPPGAAVPVTGKEVDVPGADNPYRDKGPAEGAKLFATNCVMCHGSKGKGDGAVLKTYMMEKYGYTPLRGLSPDLTSKAEPGHAQRISDGEVYSWITGGAVVMPSFRKLLSVEQRWLLVNYIHGCLVDDPALRRPDCPP